MLLNSEAIAEVFRDAYPSLCRFLKSIVREKSSAQDIAQESFLRLCSADSRDISQREMRFWLFRVARNIALNEVASIKTRTRLWSHVAQVFNRRNPTPADNYEAAENQRIVRKLLNMLPEHQRSTLLLREEENMSYREIAMVLDISESKVKVDLFRGRKALRELWFAQQEEVNR